MEKIFNELKRRLEYISELPHGNEAMIHDNIVHPIITSPSLLGWDHLEALSQFQVPLGKELKKSYIWEKAEPIFKKPDIILNPLRMNKTFAVIEEKMITETMEKLKGHSSQLTEYMQLFEVVWGLLTDGEKWILKRNFERYHEFSNLDELKKGFNDFKYCIGRDSIVERYNKTNSTDLFKVYFGNTIISTNTFLTSKQILFNEPQWLVGDTAWVIFHNINEVTYNLLNKNEILTESNRDLIIYIYREIDLYLDLIYIIKNNKTKLANNDIQKLLNLVNSIIHRYYSFCIDIVNHSNYDLSNSELFSRRDGFLNSIYVTRHFIQSLEIIVNTRLENTRPKN